MEVVLVWDELEIPPHVRAAVDALNARGVSVRVIAIRREAVPKVLALLNSGGDAPPQYRPLVSLLKRYGVRQLPALIVDGKVVAEGNPLVLGHLNLLVWSSK